MMREILTAFAAPHFCALIADDRGLVFKIKVDGRYRSMLKLPYSGMRFVEFRGQNVEITMKCGARYKAVVLQKKRLLQIVGANGVMNADMGLLPF